MRIHQDPLTAKEVARLDELLEESGSQSLHFARGVFAATATAPHLMDPGEWLSLVIGDADNKSKVRELLALLMRDYNSCVDCLSAGVPVVPAPQDEAWVNDFCRGYVRIAQRDAGWTKDTASFELTLPMMVLSGYVSAESCHKVAPQIEDFDSYVVQCRQSLADDVAAVYSYFEEARKAVPGAPAASSKVGRNEPCPCENGKKYKKCCGASQV